MFEVWLEHRRDRNSSQATARDRFRGLADILAFLHGDAGTTELDFRLEELANRELPDLRRQLAQAGFALAPAPPSAGDLRHERG